MRDIFSTGAGKLTFGFLVTSVAILVFSFLWGLSSGNDRKVDLALGFMHVGEIVGLVAFFFAIRHRMEIRDRRRNGDRS